MEPAELADRIAQVLESFPGLGSAFLASEHPIRSNGARPRRGVLALRRDLAPDQGQFFDPASEYCVT